MPTVGHRLNMLREGHQVNRHESLQRNEERVYCHKMIHRTRSYENSKYRAVHSGHCHLQSKCAGEHFLVVSCVCIRAQETHSFACLGVRTSGRMTMVSRRLKFRSYDLSKYYSFKN
jgi:hypothetical protein